jgi:ferric-dicitrate binding protein FerR (iron transport regulator)
MATWSDVERNSAQLKTLDSATLQEFFAVRPRPSQNPTFNMRFEQTMQRIRDILSDRASASSDSSEQRRHTDMMRWMSIAVAVAVIVGLLALLQKCTP